MPPWSCCAPFWVALDLAVVLDLPPERESVTYEIVQYYTPVLVGPADHSLTRKNNVTARDLREIPLILLRNAHQRTDNGAPVQGRGRATSRDGMPERGRNQNGS